MHLSVIPPRAGLNKRGLQIAPDTTNSDATNSDLSWGSPTGRRLGTSNASRVPFKKSRMLAVPVEEEEKTQGEFEEKKQREEMERNQLKRELEGKLKRESRRRC